MDIPVGNFTDKDIKKASEEFNKIIKELNVSSDVFVKFYPSVDFLKISFENLPKSEKGNAIGNEKIVFNTLICGGLKEIFKKLKDKEPFSNLTIDNTLYMNFFTHEFLHTTDKYPYPAIDKLDLMLSEGLREIISWQYTSAFLGKFYNKENSYFFDILANNSPIYKDVTDILKPIFDRFKGKDIFYKVNEVLRKNSHNSIFDDFGGIIAEMSNTKTSDNIMSDIMAKLEKLT
jgi:hypothetical protein